MINDFKKKLFPSNLGQAGMHDRYITVPRRIDPVKFFGKPPKTIELYDEIHHAYYQVPFNKVTNGEFRITRLGDFFNDRNANVGDEISFLKHEKNGETTFIIELIKN